MLFLHTFQKDIIIIIIIIIISDLEPYAFHSNFSDFLKYFIVNPFSYACRWGLIVELNGIWNSGISLFTSVTPKTMD